MSLILAQARALVAEIEKADAGKCPQPYSIDATHNNRGAVTLIFNDEATLKRFLKFLQRQP